VLALEGGAVPNASVQVAVAPLNYVVRTVRWLASVIAPDSTFRLHLLFAPVVLLLLGGCTGGSPPGFQVDLQLDHAPARDETVELVVAIEPRYACDNMRVLLSVPADTTVTSDRLIFSEELSGPDVHWWSWTISEPLSGGQSVEVPPIVAFSEVGNKTLTVKVVGLLRAGAHSLEDREYQSATDEGYTTLQCSVYEDYGSFP
jgi:hypothetical protein